MFLDTSYQKALYSSETSHCGLTGESCGKRTLLTVNTKLKFLNEANQDLGLRNKRKYLSIDVENKNDQNLITRWNVQYL